MKIYIDGDACPVLDIVQDLAQEYHLELIVVCDPHHLLNLEYGKLILVDQQRDAADFVLLRHVQENDILVTRDYGLASMALSKKAYVIHPSGKEYTDKNIDELLFQRYVSNKMRKSSGKKHLRGPKKRSHEDNERFYTALENKIKSRG